MACLTGLQKLGVASAFVNYHLKAEPLAHSLNSCNAKAVIVGHGKKIKRNLQIYLIHNFCQFVYLLVILSFLIRNINLMQIQNTRRIFCYVRH